MYNRWGAVYREVQRMHLLAGGTSAQSGCQLGARALKIPMQITKHVLQNGSCERIGFGSATTKDNTTNKTDSCSTFEKIR